MSENIVTGNDNNPVVRVQSFRPKASPIRAIPQTNPFSQLAQQRQIETDQDALAQEDEVLAQAEQSIEDEVPAIVEPSVSVSEMYETLDPTIRPAPNVNPWLNENRQIFSQIEEGLLDEYEDIELDVVSPTYPILTRPTGLSRDVDIGRMNARIERNTNRPLENMNPEGVSTPGARVRAGQPDPTRNIARGAVPPPQERPAERRFGLSDAFGNLTNLGRFITQVGAERGNLPAMIGNVLLRRLGGQQQTARTGIESVDAITGFVEGLSRDWTDPGQGTGEPDDPYRVDPMRGYFGEYGAGLTGASLAGISAVGNTTMASIYSISDLQRALREDYPTPFLLDRTGLGFFYQLYRGATEGVSGSTLPGGRELYTVPGFRYRQAFSFTDLGFTNFRRPNDSRYLSTIDPEAPIGVQVAQGALGLALDAGALGWVDDAVWGVFGRGARLLLGEANIPITSVPDLTPVPDPWMTPPTGSLVEPAPVSPGDLDVWGELTQSVDGLTPAPIPTRALPSNPAASLPPLTSAAPNYAIPPGAPSIDTLLRDPTQALLPGTAPTPERGMLPSARSLRLEDLNGQPVHPLPRRTGDSPGYQVPAPSELSNETTSVIERITTPELSVFVDTNYFIRAFENNRFTYPPEIYRRTQEELDSIAKLIFPETSEVPSFRRRELNVLDDLSNGLVAPYGRRLRLVQAIPPEERMGQLIERVPFGERTPENMEAVTRQYPQDIQDELNPGGGRPNFRNTLDIASGTVINSQGERVQILDLNDIEYQQFMNEVGMRLGTDTRERLQYIRPVPNQPADVIPFPQRGDTATPPTDAVEEGVSVTDQLADRSRILQRTVQAAGQENSGQVAGELAQRQQALLDDLAPLFDQVDEIMSKPIYQDAADEVPTSRLISPDEVNLQSMGRDIQHVQENVLDIRRHMDDLNERLVSLPTQSDVLDEIATRIMYGSDAYEVPSQRTNVRLQRLKAVDTASTEAINTGSWFHGTRNSIQELNSINPRLGSSSNELGAGVYLTRNPEIAKVYAQAERNLTNPLVETRQLVNGQVIEGEVLVGKVLNASTSMNQTSLGTLRALVREVFGEDVATYYNPSQVRDAWLEVRQAFAKAKNNAPISELEYQRFQSRVSESLQEAGFDSIYDKLMDTLVVLDPVSITTKGRVEIADTVLSPREARLAADSLLRASYFDNPVVEGLVTQSMLRVENDMLDRLVAEFNRLTDEATEVAERVAKTELAEDVARLDAIEQKLRVIENTIENSVDEAIEPDIIKGVEDTCL